MIVRWGLDSLGALLTELGIVRPLLVTSERFAALELPVAQRFAGVRRHAPVDVVEAATDAAASADGLLALGGGSAIDTAKAVSAATRLPLVAVPTMIAGIYGMNFKHIPELEWTFGYPLVLGAIAGIDAFLFSRFRKAGWL